MKHQGSLGHTILVSFCLILLVAPAAAASLAQPLLPLPQPAASGGARPYLAHITIPLLQYYLGRLCSFGPRYTGTVNNTLASEYIYNAFEDLGYQVEYHSWKHGKFQSRDVVATLPGLLPDSDGVYIVSGHFDTVKPSPGADDDGSGAMAVLAIADALKGLTLNHTIRFITFSGEEVGTYGSYTYAKEAAEQDENIIAVLNMDMIGYANTPDGGRILRFFPPSRSEWIAQYATQICTQYQDVVDLSIETLPNYRGNDAQPFIDYGYDGVWIAHHDGYAWGHSANDSIDKINWSYYAKAAQFMCALTWEIGMRPTPVQVRLTAPHEGTEYFFNHSVRELPIYKDWFTGLPGATIIVGRANAEAEVISSEPILYVIFCLDGDFKAWESSPPYSWKIWGEYSPIIGKHTLGVYAYTTKGHVAYDEMDLFVLSATYSYRRHAI